MVKYFDNKDEALQLASKMKNERRLVSIEEVQCRDGKVRYYILCGSSVLQDDGEVR